MVFEKKLPSVYAEIGSLNLAHSLRTDIALGKFL